jgi:hypothetical protein
MQSVQLFNQKNNYLGDSLLNRILNLTSLSEQERQESDLYRIYGKISLLSNSQNNNLFNSINSKKKKFFTKILSELNDLCSETNRYTITEIEFVDFNKIDLLNSNNWNYYLAYPVRSRITNTSNNGDTQTHVRTFKIIADKNAIKLTKPTLGLNIYGDFDYNFLFKKTINLSDERDYLNRPLTKLYLIFDKLSFNGVISNNPLNIVNGEIIDFDTVVYDTVDMKDTLVPSNNPTFTDTSLPISNQATFRITAGSTTGTSYNPRIYSFNRFFEIKINDFTSYFREGNIFEQDDIPTYAQVVLNDNNEDVGNRKWRDVRKKGEIDFDGNGVNYPFANGTHYINFNEIMTINNVDSNGNNIVFDMDVLFDSKCEDIDTIIEPKENKLCL